jgi:serine/threonine protein phosphatase PrpC
MTTADPVGGLRVVTATARNVRRRNEDAIGLDGWVLFGDRMGEPMETRLRTFGLRPLSVAVTDGLGGAPDGHHAARIGAQVLTSPEEDADAAPHWLVDRFRRADTAIREAGAESGRRGMACTAALLLVYADGRAVAANVGDTRVYRLKDTYVGLLSEDHRINHAESSVSRCLGGARTSTADPTVYDDPLPVRPRDRLLLCSDGLHDAVDDAGIAAALSRPDPLVAADSLIRTAVASGHGDNITVALVDVVGQPPKSAYAGATARRATAGWSDEPVCRAPRAESWLSRLTADGMAAAVGGLKPAWIRGQMTNSATAS